MRRPLVAVVALTLALGTLVGSLRGLARVDAWGWPDSAVVLRELARNAQSGLLVGLLAAVVLIGLVAAGRSLLLRGGIVPGRSGRARIQLGLWVAGLLLFICGRGPAERLLSELSPGLSGALGALHPVAVAGALALGLGALHRAWTSPFKDGNGRPLVMTALAMLLLVGSLQSISLVQVRPAPGSPNVLLLVVDCLRSDHLGAYGYARPVSPVIDRLAEHGLLLENAYTTASWTKPAVASLITGQFPHRHGALRKSDPLPPAASTLAERLGAAGYHTLFLGGNAWISDAFNFAQGYDSFEIRHEATGAELAVHLLEELQVRQDRPFFAYLHFMDVHLPYNFNHFNGLFTSEGQGAPILSSGLLNSSWARRRTAAGLMTTADREGLRGLYDGQIRFVDEQIGIVLETLERWGMLRNTLVILTADHGEEFWEHGNYEHGHSVHEEVLRVPLILYGPGIQAGRVREAASLVDIAPTIATLTGIPFEKGAFDGRALTSGSAVDRRLLAVSTLYGQERFAAFDGDRKVVLTAPATPDGLRLVGAQTDVSHELHLQGPSAERSQPAMEPAEITAEELAALEAVRAASTREGGRSLVMEDELLERFRALGYID